MPIWNFCTLCVSSGTHTNNCLFVLQHVFKKAILLAKGIYVRKWLKCQISNRRRTKVSRYGVARAFLKEIRNPIRFKFHNFQSSLRSCRLENGRAWSHEHPTRTVHSWLQKSAIFITENCIILFFGLDNSRRAVTWKILKVQVAYIECDHSFVHCNETLYACVIYSATPVFIKEIIKQFGFCYFWSFSCSPVIRL